MYGDTSTTTHDGFGGVFLQRPTQDDTGRWSQSAKTLLWIGLAVASWAAVIFAGYCIWSTL